MHDVEVYVESALADLVRAIRNGSSLEDLEDYVEAYRTVLKFAEERNND